MIDNKIRECRRAMTRYFLFCLTLLVGFYAAPALAAQDYYLKTGNAPQAAQEAQAAEEKPKSFIEKYFGWWPKKKEPSNSVFDNVPKKSGIAVQKPIVQRSKQTEPEERLSFVQSAFATIDPPQTEQITLIKEDFKNLIVETYGPCTKQDLQIISMIDAGFSQYSQELNKHIETGIANGEYDKLKEIGPDKIAQMVEETGQLPEEVKEVLRNKPEKALSMLEVITQKEYMERYAEAHVRCVNMENLPENGVRPPAGTSPATRN